MAPTQSTSTLPASHPLILELSSLRQQLHQYQRAAHQTAIQLQGSRLELSLIKEDNAVLRDTCESLKSEIEVLRTIPDPPVVQPSSTALSELSLAHRRLSSKLDITEAHLTSVQLELAASKQEIGRLIKERDGAQSIANDLRRIEEDREEEVEWERGERRKMEEQKKLCDLALSEYSNLVHSLDPSAVPPINPLKDTTSNILNTPVDLNAPPTPSTASSSSEAISNLLVGQRGVQRLFQDFTSTLSVKEKEIHRLSIKIEELEHSILTLKDQLKDETELRIQSDAEREKVLRDDASAAKVVERYMSFSQKNAQTLHSHLSDLRNRSSATQTTLRKEAVALRNRLRVESERTERLRAAMDEMSEGLSREAAGRRREVALRLKMIADEEKRERKVEMWLDRVRLARDGADGAVLEADVLESLVDEGIEALNVGSLDKGGSGVSKDKMGSWGRRLLGGRKGKTPVTLGNGEESSIARVLLAEDLVTVLVQDLQEETERRMELERQRVDWLAKEAVDGVEVKADGGEEVMFDAEADDVDHLDSATNDDVLQTPDRSDISSTPEPSPLLAQLQEIFEPLEARYPPLQKTLHDLSSSLTSLRSSLPTLPVPDSPISPTRTKKPTFLAISRRPLAQLHPASDPALTTLLDGIHEVIEDARVDVEIEMADEERVYHGFEALLGVGGGGNDRGIVVQKGEVLRDAQEFVDERKDGKRYKKLVKRVEDLEYDLTLLKMTLHEVETNVEEEPTEEEGNEKTPLNGNLSTLKSDKRSIWQTIPLRTVSTSIKSLSPLQSPAIDQNGHFHLNSETDPRKRTSSTVSLLSTVGRSFSSSVIGAPRRVSGLANGLYKLPGGKVDNSPKAGQVDGSLGTEVVEDGGGDDDVE